MLKRVRHIWYGLVKASAETLQDEFTLLKKIVVCFFSIAEYAKVSLISTLSTV